MKYRVNKKVNPKVSVIIPVYNVEMYLNECLDSILAQSFQNIEIVLVDDGSTDSSGQICDIYAKKDMRISVIHQENQGLSGARNSGVKAASSEWITLVDSDDVIHPQMIEMLYEAIEAFDANMSFCKYVKAEKEPDDFRNKLENNTKFVIIDEKQLEKYYCGVDVAWTVTTKLIRKDLYLKYPMEIGRIYEDNAVSCKWMYEAKSVVEINHGLYFYRQRQASIMSTTFSEKNLDYLWALEEQIKFFYSVRYYNVLKEAINNYIASALALKERVEKEIPNKKIEDKIKKNIIRIWKKYRKYVKLEERELQLIERELYPIRYKVKKKIRRIFT